VRGRPPPARSTVGAVSPEDALRAWGAYDLDDPFPLFAALREHGPVHEVTLADGHAAWVVLGYDDARTALNDPRLSKNMQAAFSAGDDVVAEGLPGPELARHMLAVDPPDHTRLRRLVSGAFTPKRVEALRGHVDDIVDALLDDVAARSSSGPVDLVATFAFPLPFTVICELLGVAGPDRDRLGHGLITLLSPTPTPEAWDRAKAASDQVVAMLGALVAEKRAHPADDLVSALVDARDAEGGLDEAELLSTIFQLIVAGHDTTTSLIGNGLVALLRHPDQLAALRADPALLPSAIEELLRFDAPVPHATFRFAAEAVELGGVTIPAGAQVLVALASANRDESHYDNAEALELGRASSRHLAFGHGIHACLGAPLARMEGQIAFHALLTRFPDLELAVPFGDLHWAHGDGLVLRGLSELPVHPGPDRKKER
jgi:cytochrome P450